MKRRGPTKKKSVNKKYRPSSDQFDAISTLNDPVHGIFDHTKDDDISCSIVPMGNNKNDRFFLPQNTLRPYTTKTTHTTTKIVQANFYHRKTPSAVKRIVAGYDCSFLITGMSLLPLLTCLECGECYAAGSNQYCCIGVAEMKLQVPQRILPDHKISFIASSQMRTVFLTG
jgi:hypothetical protein